MKLAWFPSPAGLMEIRSRGYHPRNLRKQAIHPGRGVGKLRGIHHPCRGVHPLNLVPGVVPPANFQKPSGFRSRYQTLFGDAAVLETPFRFPARVWPLVVQRNRVPWTSCVILKSGMGFRAKNARDAKTEAFEGNPTKINITTRVKGSFCITSSLGGLSVLCATLKCRF
jgi:hypothetical protein